MGTQVGSESRCGGASNSDVGILYIVDDDANVLNALKRLADEVFLPCQAFSTAAEFLAAYEPRQPGCLVLDVRMPGMSGMELQKRLAEEGIMLPVIMLTGHGTVPMAVSALRHGAFDFLEKPVNLQSLLDRIQHALAYDCEARRRRAERSAIVARVASLTPRERKVVDLAVTGATNKRIARELGVSSQAIDAHRACALHKMGVETVPQLVRLMLEAELERTRQPAAPVQLTSHRSEAL